MTQSTLSFRKVPGDGVEAKIEGERLEASRSDRNPRNILGERFFSDLQ